MSDTQRRLASLQAGAAYANVSEGTIRRWIRTGKLPGYRVGERLLRVDLDELDKLICPVSR